jgi:hypothetical protein
MAAISDFSNQGVVQLSLNSMAACGKCAVKFPGSFLLEIYEKYLYPDSLLFLSPIRGGFRDSKSSI